MDDDDPMAGGASSPARDVGGSAATSGGKRGAKTSVARTADETVFNILTKEFPAEREQQTLKLNEEAVQSVNRELGLAAALSLVIPAAYPSVPYPVAWKVANKAAERLKAVLDGTDGSSAGGIDPELQERLQIAFTKLDYIGDAGDKFVEYLKRSWHAYQGNHGAYKAPYAAIVQSSGFGKSRLLLKLAQETIEHDEWGMRVLYTCTRFGKSTGFPVATDKLRDWLFGSNHDEFMISRHLVAAYHYAQENWSTVGNEWIELFTSSQADEAVQKKLEDTEAKLWPKSNESATEASTDKAKAAQVQPSAQETSKAPGGVLILAVDEARALLSLKHDGLDYFRLLRKALGHANEHIRASQPTGGIFAVLVDTNSKVSDLTPPLLSDPSSRNDKSAQPLSLFPPFVLSHTMDAYWRRDHPELKMAGEISPYKFVVTQNSAEVAWNALISMGRPMWASMYHASMTKYYGETGNMDSAASTATNLLLTLAARKLLLGCDPGVEADYNEKTMFGVASMLCRLGLRPYSTSALASRTVADFMAILAYVNYENDGQLSSYASDPVLALGATHVWYALDSALPKYILPQFKKLLLHEVLDAGGVGEVVARIVLLLVMDACVVMKTKAVSHCKCQFTGQFVSVQSFLKALGGEQPPVMMTKQARANAKTVKAFKVWRSQWNRWEMGFCHFVQLDREPTEATLWFLLGRRAAGVFPRNQSGADLVIPMYCGSEVSLILVQVKNVEDRDSKFPKWATVNMHPSFVFDAENPLSAKSSRDVIRVYMSLREPVPERNPDRFFLTELNGAVEPPQPVNRADSSAEGSSNTTPPPGSKKKAVTTATPSGAIKKGTTVLDTAESARTAASQPSNDAFTLCIRSVRAWELVVETVTRPVLSAAVATELADLASSLWDPMGLVNGDLRDRSAMEEKLRKSVNELCLSPVMPDAELLEIASRALTHAPGYVARDDEGGEDSVETVEGKPAVPTSTACAPASSDQQSRSSSSGRKRKGS